VDGEIKMKIYHETVDISMQTLRMPDGKECDVDLFEAPHECTVPACPGNLNRRKLEMFDEMLSTLISARSSVSRRWTVGGLHDFDKVISKASELKPRS
jgi:hypothetical protein